MQQAQQLEPAGHQAEALERLMRRIPEAHAEALKVRRLYSSGTCKVSAAGCATEGNACITTASAVCYHWHGICRCVLACGSKLERRLNVWQAGGAAALEKLLAEETEEAKPEFLKQRPKVGVREACHDMHNTVEHDCDHQHTAGRSRLMVQHGRHVITALCLRP